MSLFDVLSKDREEAIYESLKGQYKHFCPDWDYMAIDETCPEWDACTCGYNRFDYKARGGEQ